MNNFIENVSRIDIINGNHSNAGENSMLIQISDIGVSQPTPNQKFKEIYDFQFEDISEETKFSCTNEQAKRLAELLVKAKENHMNVIVHCHAGLCRSGAVVEAGIAIGFNPPNRNRIPNTLVKKKIINALCLSINKESSMFAEEHCWQPSDDFT